MNKKDVQLNSVYVAKVSGKLARVRILSESPYGGWDATNLETKRDVRILTAARLRYPAEKLATPVYCGDCLMEHVDCVPLRADGKCNCCATGHKFNPSRRPIESAS